MRPSFVRPLGPLAVALVHLAIATPALADRPAVEQTLAEMARAVRAGDGAAYLAHVDRVDALFRTEQERWAKDLAEHRPAAFELSIAEPAAEGARPPVFADDEARFELVVTWAMARDEHGGPAAERTVSFPVRFVPDEAGARWLYAGEDWKVLEGDGDEPAPATEASTSPGGAAKPAAAPVPPRRRARVKHLPGYEGVAARIVRVLPGVRESVHAALGVTVDRVQEVKLYPSVRHLQASIALSYAQPLGGWNEPGESIKLLVRPGTGEASLRGLLAHEYGHVATFELGPRANDMPWWVIEGVAEMTAEPFTRGRRDAAAAVAAWHAAGTLAPWAELADFRTVPAHQHRRVYKQGQSMLDFITDRHGPAARNAWLLAMAAGATPDAAARAALGTSFDDLDAAWRAHIAEDAEERPKE